MSVSFDVKFYGVPKQHENSDGVNRYYNYWHKGRYNAENIRCCVSARCKYESVCFDFTCSSHTIETCIHEAEFALLDCDCGKAELFDGNYRIATITKHLDDGFVNSNLTKYGKKCHNYER